MWPGMCCSATHTTRSIMKTKHVVKGMIHKSKKKHRHSKKYDHWLVCMTGDFYVVDMFPCTKEGCSPAGMVSGEPNDVSILGAAVDKI